MRRVRRRWKSSCQTVSLGEESVELAACQRSCDRPVANIDVGDPPALLLFLIPHRNYENKRRRYAGLEDAENRSANHQPSVILTGGMGSKSDAPEHYIGAKVLPQP